MLQCQINFYPMPRFFIIGNFGGGQVPLVPPSLCPSGLTSDNPSHSCQLTFCLKLTCMMYNMKQTTELDNKMRGLHAASCTRPSVQSLTTCDDAH